MSSIRFATTIVLIAFLIAVSFMEATEAAYRKPPFNGSIFGKRNSVEYDNAKAMCEIAMEACQAWFPQPENK